MVLINIMRIFSKIFLAIAFLFSFSCEDQGLFIKCPDCLADEPSTTNLEVKLGSGSSAKEAIINVYEGNLEDSVLHDSFKTIASSQIIPVTLNKKYTVTATYYISDNYYIAVDSATPRVRKDNSQCENPCYYVYDKDIDLRLKYTK
jgi:hypothetical protein